MAEREADVDADEPADVADLALGSDEAVAETSLRSSRCIAELEEVLLPLAAGLLLLLLPLPAVKGELPFAERA